MWSAHLPLGQGPNKLASPGAGSSFFVLDVETA
jgi:hypothetical protein